MGYRGIPKASSPTQRFTLNMNLVPQEPLGMGGEPSDGAWPEDGFRAQGAPGCGICKVNSCTKHTALRTGILKTGFWDQSPY